jgi:chitin synthase
MHPNMFTRAESNRYSMVSTSDYHAPTTGYENSTHDSTGYVSSPRRSDPNQLLMLPTPLSVSRMTPTTASISTAALSRSSDEGGSDIGSSHQRLIPASQEGGQFADDYEGSSGSTLYSPRASPFDQHVVSRPGRQSYTSSYMDSQVPHAYPQPTGYAGRQPMYTNEPDELPNVPQATASRAQSRTRGVSLADNGPVPAPGGVRRVSRQPNKRPTSQAPPSNRYSRGSSLPPGAAPPQPPYGYHQ